VYGSLSEARTSVGTGKVPSGPPPHNGFADAATQGVQKGKRRHLGVWFDGVSARLKETQNAFFRQ